MGWGKAVIAWCRNPDDALAALMELNNTYALDGHSPPSVGGLMGCMGLFESPKGDTPIYGAVQQRGCKRKYMALGKAQDK
jgi:deoxyribodipyrimidine photo-lyase